MAQMNDIFPQERLQDLINLHEQYHDALTTYGARASVGIVLIYF